MMEDLGASDPAAVAAEVAALAAALRLALVDLPAPLREEFVREIHAVRDAPDRVEAALQAEALARAFDTPLAGAWSRFIDAFGREAAG